VVKIIFQTSDLPVGPSDPCKPGGPSTVIGKFSDLSIQMQKKREADYTKSISFHLHRSILKRI
jgi:hypothetical protein